MDPLSATASSVAFATVVIASVKKLKEIRGASDALRALLADVEHLKDVLEELKLCLEQRRQHLGATRTLDRLCLLVEATQRKLGALNDLIEERQLKRKTGSTQETKAAHIPWMRFHSRAEKMRAELLSCREGLAGVCQALQLTDAVLLHQKLDKHLAGLQDQHDSAQAQSANILRIQEQACTLLQEMKLSMSYTKRAGDDISTSAQDTSGSSGSSWQSHSNTSLIQRRMDEAFMAPAANQDTLTHVRAARYRESYCEAWCSCTCHVAQTYQTPHLVDAMIGSLTIGSVGLHLGHRACSEPTCRRQSVPMFKLLWYLPSWLCLRVVNLAVSFTQMTGPQIALSIPRVVPSDSKIFQYAVQGDLAGIQDLFAQGLASPYDVGAVNGRTALHYAVNYDHYTVSKFLKDKGANADLEDKDRDSTVALAWGRIFSNFADQTTIDGWRCMFDDEEYLESRAFPPLHKIVLNLNGARLEDQLALSSATVNDQDPEGRTALSWAAARCNLEAVKILLHYKADPNIICNRRTSPLQYAAQSHSVHVGKVLEALLAAKAEADHVNGMSRTALIFAGCNQADPANVLPLIKHGASLDKQDIRGRTSLGYAAKMGNHRTVQLLLDEKADPRISDDHGNPPIFEAIEGNHSQTVKALLKKSRPNVLHDRAGHSIIWAAARHGKASMLTSIATDIKNIPELSFEAADLKGAEEVFLARPLLDEDEMNAFQSLKDTVLMMMHRRPRFLREDSGIEMGPEDAHCVRGDDSVEDDFHDAFERL